MAGAKATPPKLKVSRNRKRLYEAPVVNLAPEQEAVLTTAGSEETVAEAIIKEHGDATSLDAQQAAFRLARARRRVDYYTAVAGTVGVLPVPVIDMLTVGGLQLKLIHDLSKIYAVPFSSQRAKAGVAALLSGAQTGLMVKSLFKYIPVFGYPVVAVPAALATGAVTYAVGRVFIRHFELGGTLLDFDASKLRSYFQNELKRKTPQKPAE